MAQRTAAATLTSPRGWASKSRAATLTGAAAADSFRRASTDQKKSASSPAAQSGGGGENTPFAPPPTPWRAKRRQVGGSDPTRATNPPVRQARREPATN
jgi:hypothetical protein